MSLGQYFDIIGKKLSKSTEKNCDCSQSIRSWGRNVIGEKEVSENCQAEGRIKYSYSENSKDYFELSETSSELVKTGFSNLDEAMRNFQSVIDLLQLSREQAEQLYLSMLGEVNREEQADIKYRYDQRSGQEMLVISS